MFYIKKKLLEIIYNNLKQTIKKKILNKTINDKQKQSNKIAKNK